MFYKENDEEIMTNDSISNTVGLLSIFFTDKTCNIRDVFYLVIITRIWGYSLAFILASSFLYEWHRTINPLNRMRIG